MAVQVWIGEKPEHPNERRAIVALANGLERLEGLYLLLVNFNVGGRTVDLAVVKHDAIFIIELKHCDGTITGGVNGPWMVEDANGERKELNLGRGNPYNQAISCYYSLTNFLHRHRTDFLSEHRAKTVNFRTCRRLIVIAPTIQEGSDIHLDWKVEIRGLDELPAFLVTERSLEIDLSEEEMLAIPALLQCTRWNDINELLAGVFPAWHATNIAQQPDASRTNNEEARPAVLHKLRGGLHTVAGRLALFMSTLVMVLLLVLVVRSVTPPMAQAPPHVSLINATSGPAGGVFGGGRQEDKRCVWSEFQPIGKYWDKSKQAWISVGIDRTPGDLSPEIVVVLETVTYCQGQIELTWSVHNNSNRQIMFPLQNNNITIRDPLGNMYDVASKQSQPRVIRVDPGEQERGTAIVPGPVMQDAPSLLVRLNEKPFGEASWLVSLEGN